MRRMAIGSATSMAKRARRAIHQVDHFCWPRSDAPLTASELSAPFLVKLQVYYKPDARTNKPIAQLAIYRPTAITCTLTSPHASTARFFLRHSVSLGDGRIALRPPPQSAVTAPAAAAR